MKRGVSAFLFLAVFICTSSSAQAQAPQNLLENEFFEEWENGEPTDWKTQFVPVQSEESLVGNYSLMSEGAYYQYAYQEVEVEEGETYYLEAWWQVLTGKGDITLRYRNEAEEDYDLDEDRLTPEDGWKSLEGNHTAKSSGNITIRLGHHRNGDEDSKILSGAAWLGTDEPPKDWLLKNESENDTAENVSEYVLNIDATEGGNTEPSEGEHFYEENETVSVEAAPDDGWEFVEW
ncbi:MAG: InlB B-repeat-containing protein, partial [Candidatus Aenigmatarchaeota archaeon]